VAFLQCDRFFPSPPRGSQFDLFHLSAKLAESGAEFPQLYQCCGTEDFLYEDNLKFKEHIEKLPFEHCYEEAPGAHEWGFWDIHIQKALEWMLG